MAPPMVLASWLNRWRSEGVLNLSLDVARKQLARRAADVPAPVATVGKVKLFDQAAAETILRILREQRPAAAAMAC